MRERQQGKAPSEAAKPIDKEFPGVIRNAMQYA
jgi:hypothetical protein